MSKFYSSLLAITKVESIADKNYGVYEFIDVSDVEPSQIESFLKKKKIPRIRLSIKLPNINSRYIPDLSEIIQPNDILLNVKVQNTEIINVPKIELPISRNNVVNLIEEFAKTNRFDANTIYEIFYKQTKITYPETKSSYEFLTTASIDKISSSVFYSKKEAPDSKCKDFPISPEKMRTFFMRWYVMRPVRRLHYLGISKDVIQKYSYKLHLKNSLKKFENKPAIHLFRNIVVNPYTLCLNEKVLTLEECANLWKIYHPILTEADVFEANLIYNSCLILVKCMNEFLSKNHVVVPMNVLLNYQKKLMEDMLKEKISKNPAHDIKTVLIERFLCKFITFQFPYDMCLPKIRANSTDFTPSEIANIKKVIVNCKSKKESTCLMMNDSFEKYKFIAEYINKIKQNATVYNYETLTQNISRRINSTDSDIIMKEFAIDKNLTHEQNSAVLLALCNHISFIVGPAGSGKTRVIKEITNQLNLKSVSCKYFCLAFTGKAVSKLRSEINKQKHDSIMTIDMFKLKITSKKLDISPDISHIHIIIDEVSMITTDMLYNLFFIMNSMYPHLNITYVFLGDKFQLQPILTSVGSEQSGNGQLLHNISLSKSVVIYDLDAVHRYTNGISKNATIIRQAISENYYPINPNFYPHIRSYYMEQQKCKKIFKLESDDDFKIIQIPNTREHLPGYLNITEIITEYMKNDYNFKILTPKIEHVNKINKLCSKIYHSQIITSKKNAKITLISTNTGLCQEINSVEKLSTMQIEDSVICYTEGDPVMVIENESKNDIFNGEEYIISNIDTEGIECVNYSKDDLSGKSDKIRLFKYADLETSMESKDKKSHKLVEITTKYITPSYCITCHKSQGSEWDHVVIYIPTREVSIFEGDSFIDSSMIYTSITRAKKSVVIIGDVSYINEIINIPIQFKADVLYSIIDNS